MIKPFNNRVLIERKKLDTHSEGGIILPDAALDRKINEGFVIEVSEGCKLEVGQYVIFNEFAGNDVAWGEDPYLLLPEEEVIGILEDN